MNSVDYTQKANRQNELYQQKLREQRNNHEERLAEVKSAADKRVESAKEAYVRDKDQIEKSHREVTNNLRKTQQEELANKSKRYVETVEQNKNNFHDLREKTLKEWRTKFGDLQKSYNDSLRRNEESSKESKNVMAANYKENLDNVRNKSEADVKNFIETTYKARGDNSEAQREVLRNKDLAHQEDKNKLIQAQLRADNKYKKDITAEVSDMRKKQEAEFNKGREVAQERFSKQQQNLNSRQAKFENDTVKRMTKKQQEENRINNDTFQQRYADLDRKYEKSLRDRDNRARAEKITKGDLSKRILAEQRANEANEMTNKTRALMDERTNLSRNYDNKLSQQEEIYQDTYEKVKLANADKIARHNLKVTEENRQKDLNTKIRETYTANNHRIELEYSEDRAKDRLTAQQRNSDVQIQNLKEDFTKGMELAQLKAKSDFEKNREETIKEKAELQKRLHESNSKTNTYLKKVYSDKIQRMENSFEKRIAELEAQNDYVQQNANDAIMDITERSNREVERQREIAINNAKQLVQEERKAAAEQQNQMDIKITKLQQNFSKKLQEQTLLSRRRLKKTVKEYDIKLFEQDKKYRDIIDQNNKLFERELARLSSARKSEREILITQYENRIKELQKAQQDKIQELKEFDRVSNNA